MCSGELLGVLRQLENPCARLPKVIVGRPTQNLFRGRVEVVDATIRIYGDHAVGDRTQRRLCARLFRNQLLFQLPPFGDVAHARYPARSVCRIPRRSEEHTSELQSLMRISYAVFCLKKKNTTIYQS